SRRVFEARSFGEFVLKHMSHEPVPPRDLTGVQPLPRELERTILRCLQKRPEDRFQTATELRGALIESLTALETASVDAEVARAKGRRSFYLGLAIGAAGFAAVLTFAIIWRAGGRGGGKPVDLSERSSETPPTPTQPSATTGPLVEHLGGQAPARAEPRPI